MSATRFVEFAAAVSGARLVLGEDGELLFGNRDELLVVLGNVPTVPAKLVVELVARDQAKAAEADGHWSTANESVIAPPYSLVASTNLAPTPALDANWVAVDKRPPHVSVSVRARLWFAARDLAVPALAARQQVAVSSEHVQLSAVAEGESIADAAQRLRAKVLAEQEQAAGLALGQQGEAVEGTSS